MGNESVISDTDTFEGEETLGGELRDKDENQLRENENVYPDATVNIAPESASVFQLKRKYDKNPPLLKLDPDFQRHTVWTEKQKCELIESILMGIPLPLIYVKEDDKGVYIIVDGRQRLTTLFQFMNHEFALQNLTVLTGVNNCYFSEESPNGVKRQKYLTPAQQSKIEDCPLTLHVIKPPTKDRITFDLFDRVNRGGTRLNNQEMRNAIYQGPATRLLNQLVKLESFKKATENTIKPERMKDKYLVLRLIAFYLWRKKELLSVKETGTPLVDYRSDLEDFLGKTMLFLNDSKGELFAKEFIKRFDLAMKRSVEILGTGCFRIPKKSEGPRRPISMALFETVGFLILETLDVGKNKDVLIRTAFKNLFEDEASGFVRSLTYTVDSNISVFNRFLCMENIIKEIRNA
ncbi:MAG: DUF262 domain-containing protein [Fibrobacter sp.]|nr:DUF262 domain-containing protein [Fibrobacter sp.]